MNNFLYFWKDCYIAPDATLGCYSSSNGGKWINVLLYTIIIYLFSGFIVLSIGLYKISRTSRQVYPLNNLSFQYNFCEYLTFLEIYF
jgi:hypothetical protein